MTTPKDNEFIPKDPKYYSGAQIFTGLAKAGKLEELITHVYTQSDPYMNYVPCKSKLAKNALSFFCIEKHTQAIEDYFTSPFINDITPEDFQDAITSVIYSDNIDILRLIEANYARPFTPEENRNILLLANRNNSHKIIQYLLPQNTDQETLTQEEKIYYFVDLLANAKYGNTLRTFKMLESHFSDLKYHQQDDIIMTSAVKNKQQEVVHYLLFDKKLRITKHINHIGYINQEFAKLLTTRKLFDSLEQKSRNRFEKMQQSGANALDLSIQKITPKRKI